MGLRGLPRHEHNHQTWRRLGWWFPGGVIACVAMGSTGGCVLDLGDPIPEGSISVPSTGLTGDAAPEPTEPTDVTDPPDDVPDESAPLDDPATDEVVPEPVFDSGAAGGPNSGPDGAAGGPGICEPGFVACDAGCVFGTSCAPIAPSCAETCARDHAQTSCVQEVCTLLECDPGWVDCDGELDNGCEVPFGEQTPPSPILVPRHTTSTESDWSALPVYPLAQPCGECGQDFSGLPEQVPVYEDEAPAPRSDLMVGVSLAWGDSGLALRAVVFDDEVRVGDDSNSDPRYYDALQVVFDGGNLGTGTDAQDHVLFLGIDGTPYDQRIPGTDALRTRVSVVAEPLGVNCRVLRARLSLDYLGGGDELALEPGDQFGFALSFNDFDSTSSDPPQVQRQHEVFLQTPGDGYVYGPRDLPRIELFDTAAELSDAGVP